MADSRLTIRSARHGTHDVLFDSSDAAVVAAHRWFLAGGRTGPLYAVANVYVDGRRTQVKMHKLITGWAETDHRNRNGLDNRRGNLRSATRAQNNANRPMQRNNTSGYKGVTPDRQRAGRWVAQIQSDRRCHYLGSYATAQAAALSYDAAAVRLFGEFARCNFSERTA